VQSSKETVLMARRKQRAICPFPKANIGKPFADIKQKIANKSLWQNWPQLIGYLRKNLGHGTACAIFAGLFRTKA